jgi:hypothetical protein
MREKFHKDERIDLDYPLVGNWRNLRLRDENEMVIPEWHERRATGQGRRSGA